MGGRRKFAWPRAAFTATSVSSETALAVLRRLTRRFSFAAWSGVYGPGWLPSSIGTAPPGAALAKRMPVTAVARPVTATAATEASFAIASRRSRADRLLGFASFTRAPAQPATIAASPAELIQPYRRQARLS